MVWFRVDDAFWRGKKVRKLQPNTLEGRAAIGLWTLAGDWSADNLSDGFVPFDVIDMWDPERLSTKRLMMTPSDAPLWEPMTKDGEDGIYFHDWPDHNPLRADVEKKRADQRERVRKFRERSGRFGSSEDQPGDAPGNALRTPQVTPAPTRPDPKGRGGTVVRTEGQSEYMVTLADADGKKSASPRGSRIPEDFKATEAMVDWARRETPHVDGRYETAQFIDYWNAATGQTAVKKDWVRTWQRWMRKAERDHAERASKRRSAADEWELLDNAK